MIYRSLFTALIFLLTSCSSIELAPDRELLEHNYRNHDNQQRKVKRNQGRVIDQTRNAQARSQLNYYKNQQKHRQLQRVKRN